MTSKPTSLDLLNKLSIGFTPLFDDFFSQAIGSCQQSYPPYSIAHIDHRSPENGDSLDDYYEITMAVAGFTKDDISITIDDSTLNVSGKSEALDSPESVHVNWIHKGIAERSFIRQFKLAQHVEVRSADLEHGILKIKLVVNVPEDRTKTIAING